MKQNLLEVTAILFTAGLSQLAHAQTNSTSGFKDWQEPNTMRDETVGIIPQIGVMTYVQADGNTGSRQLMGLGIDVNFGSLFENSVKNYFLGVSTGAFYSHVGSSSSDFFGSNATTTSTPGANLVLIPVDLKIGYHFNSTVRGSIHGGGNVIYRSIASLTSLGTGDENSDSNWSIYPNVGMDLEFQVGDNVAIIIRPDLTIAPENNLFTGTAGATIAL